MGYHSPRCYSLTSNTAAASPLDSTVYYVGGSSTSFGTNSASRRFYIPYGGTVRTAAIMTYSATTDGSNEAWVFSLTDGTTTTQIDSLAVSAAQRNWINNNMNFPVVEGGYVQFTTTTPAWAVNPEGMTTFCVLVIEME